MSKTSTTSAAPTGAIATVRQSCATLQAELDTLSAQIAGHEAERAALDRQLAAATLADDPLPLAAAKIRRDLLDREITRLRSQERTTRAQRENSAELLGRMEERVWSAQALVDALRAGDMQHPRLRDLEMRELPDQLARAREVIRSAGGEVEPITVTL